MADSPYATVDDLIGWLDAPAAAELSDERSAARHQRMELLLGAASSAVDSYCERTFDCDTTETTKTFYPPALIGRSALSLPVGDNQSVSSVVIDDTTLSATSYRAERTLRRSPWTVLRRLDRTAWQGAVEVTGVWGWDEVPDGIIVATLMQAARWYQRPKSPLGVQIIGDEGDALYVRINDPDIKTILREFKRR